MLLHQRPVEGVIMGQWGFCTGFPCAGAVSINPTLSTAVTERERPFRETHHDMTHYIELLHSRSVTFRNIIITSSVFSWHLFLWIFHNSERIMPEQFFKQTKMSSTLHLSLAVRSCSKTINNFQLVRSSCHRKSHSYCWGNTPMAVTEAFP